MSNAGRKEREAINRARWERENRNRWIQEGFKAARQQAFDICHAIADRSDFRSSQERQAGRPPSNLVRAVRNAGHRIRNMSSPNSLVAKLQGEADPDVLLPCDVHLPPATLVKAGCSVALLAEALALPGRQVSFSDQPNDEMIIIRPEQQPTCQFEDKQ